MPINKNAFLRFQILDRCFASITHRYGIDDLLKEINQSGKCEPISRRQLFDDMNAMKQIVLNQNAIRSIRDGRRTYYRYADPQKTLFNVPLSPEEEELLEPALAMLASVAGAPQVEAVKRLLPSIQSRLRYKDMGSDILYVESNVDLKGVEHLQTLYVAIRKQQVLDILYRDFRSAESYPIRFHPHILKQFNGRWFVLGTNEAKPSLVWVSPLDRVESINAVSGDYLPSSTDWVDYFDEIIGVTNPKDAPILDIRLRFAEGRMSYVRTKPLHGSQRIFEPNEISIKVKRNPELESAILFFGDDVEVLEPKELREAIGDRLGAAKEKYA
jgi:predicted DNA-binding transcriptional regulator YafY